MHLTQSRELKKLPFPEGACKLFLNKRVLGLPQLELVCLVINTGLVRDNPMIYTRSVAVQQGLEVRAKKEKQKKNTPVLVNNYCLQGLII